MLIWEQYKEKYQKGGFVILERKSVAFGYMIRKEPFKSYHIFHKDIRIARKNTLKEAKQAALKHHKKFLSNS